MLLSVENAAVKLRSMVLSTEDVAVKFVFK